VLAPGERAPEGAVVREAEVIARRTRRGRVEVVADLDLVVGHDPVPTDPAVGGTVTAALAASSAAGPLPEPGERVRLVADEGAVATIG
jgi:hypothetical protein